jgi:hypothetical protein
VFLGLDSCIVASEFHFITNEVQKNIGFNQIYLNVNRVPIIHLKNNLEIYLEYVNNMPLFHNIFKNILLPLTLPKIYKNDLPKDYLPLYNLMFQRNKKCLEIEINNLKC